MDHPSPYAHLRAGGNENCCWCSCALQLATASIVPHAAADTNVASAVLTMINQDLLCQLELQ